MKKIYAIFRSGTSGGTATLSLRLGKWLISQGFDVLYICQHFNHRDNVEAMENAGIRVHRWELDEIGANLAQRYDGCSFACLAYSLDEFLFVESLKKTVSIEVNMLYVVHHFALIKRLNRCPATNWLMKTFYGQLISKMVENGAVVFMDEKSVRTTKVYYSPYLNEMPETVISLPFEVQRYDATQLDNKDKNKFNLLTIARAEFPFKGYIIGLIDAFSALCSTYNHLTLTIVSFGPDINKVYERVDALPESVRSRIRMVGATPYHELCGHFGRAHLYLGMGTTVLDAANHGVPSVLVEDYTYECNSTGFFHQKPQLPVADGDVQPAVNFIEVVLQLNEQEYRSLCETEHRALAAHYDVARFGEHCIGASKPIEYSQHTSAELLIHGLFGRILKCAQALKNFKARLTLGV